MENNHVVTSVKNKFNYVEYGNESINLYGKLARIFEKTYNHTSKNIKIKAHSIKDVMCSMEANFPGFRSLIKKTGFYRVVMGESLTDGRELEKEDSDITFNKNTSWHIMPVAQCSGNVARIIVGVVLVIVGVVLNVYTGYSGTPFIQMGVGFILGGVAGLLAPNPTVGNYSDSEKADEKPSYLFNGTKNTVEPGTTIPVMYGEFYCNTISVSGGVRITNVI